jgi:hypothetical protein
MKRFIAQLFAFIAALVLLLTLMAGGRPSKGTPKDMRLARNNPNAGKSKPATTTTTVTSPAGLPPTMPPRAPAKGK